MQTTATKFKRGDRVTRKLYKGTQWECTGEVTGLTLLQGQAQQAYYVKLDNDRPGARIFFESELEPADA